MAGWPGQGLLDRIGVDLPIIQAPMAGASGPALAVEVCRAGGLGSLPCALLDADQVRAQLRQVRAATDRPVNLNFFCHALAEPDPERAAHWQSLFADYYREFGLEVPELPPAATLAPFDASMCEVLESERPSVVSFHFGLPAPAFVLRLKVAGCMILSSATTVREALWLEAHGCDAIIAQGCEAGGHRGMFLEDDMATQSGTFALLPQIVEAVSVPVIAAGGIANGRGIAAAFMLGASCVQIGTAYLVTPESLISPLYRARLNAAGDDETALTNVFTGRPARSLLNRVMREIGPMSRAAPSFPGAGGALAPLRKAAEAQGSTDFSSLWCGQAVALCVAMPAGELTVRLASEARQHLATRC